MDSHEPPLYETYQTLLLQSSNAHHDDHDHHYEVVIEDCDLPSIDLSRLSGDDVGERERCMYEITQAAKDWGFFQVVNHGISDKVLMSLESEQKKLFYEPFYNKVDEHGSAYRWGNSAATCLNQLSWSEAFHFSIADISSSMKERQRRVLKRFAKRSTEITKTLTEILVQNLGSVQPTCFSRENCPPSSSYIRLNRYPPCPFASSVVVFGLIPHTDSDFISIVHQDHIGGLQLLKDGNWIGVNPNPQALIVNIGDLLEAISNGVYKSVKHRVIATEAQRFSQAYFYCPADETILENCTESAPFYRNFTFREYKQQVRNDVRETGDKIGLQRFLM